MNRQGGKGTQSLREPRWGLQRAFRGGEDGLDRGAGRVLKGKETKWQVLGVAHTKAVSAVMGGRRGPRAACRRPGWGLAPVLGSRKHPPECPRVKMALEGPC